MAFGQFNDPDPHPSPPSPCWRVQAQQADEPRRFGARRDECAVRIDPHRKACQRGRRIRNGLSAFADVTGSAGIDEIVVVQGEVGFELLGYEMIQIELPRRAAPLLTNQAVRTTERELVPQPGAEGLDVRIPAGAMPSVVWLRGILERGAVRGCRHGVSAIAHGVRGPRSSAAERRGRNGRWPVDQAVPTPAARTARSFLQCPGRSTRDVVTAAPHPIHPRSECDLLPRIARRPRGPACSHPVRRTKLARKVAFRRPAAARVRCSCGHCSTWNGRFVRVKIFGFVRRKGRIDLLR